jgi:hypothetical protein
VELASEGTFDGFFASVEPADRQRSRQKT